MLRELVLSFLKTAVVILTFYGAYVLSIRYGYFPAPPQSWVELVANAKSTGENVKAAAENVAKTASILAAPVTAPFQLLNGGKSFPGIPFAPPGLSGLPGLSGSLPGLPPGSSPTGSSNPISAVVNAAKPPSIYVGGSSESVVNKALSGRF